MVDIAADTTTTAAMSTLGFFVSTMPFPVITSAGSYSGRIETAADKDWIRIEGFQAGMWTFFAQSQDAGSGYGDAVLTLFNAAGGFITDNDDRDLIAGLDRNSQLSFNLALNTTYFLQIERHPSGQQPGTYTVSAITGTPSMQTAGVTLGDDTITAAGAGTYFGDGGDDIIDLSAAGNNAMGDQGDDQLSGNALKNVLYGGLGNDLFWETPRIDVLFGDAGDDRLDGGTEIDKLDGGDGFDVLFGGDGADQLIGGEGDDIMQGGIGDDIYIVDSQGDIIMRPPAKAAGTWSSSVSFTLAADDDIESMSASFSATAVIYLTGNALAQTLQGNNGANILDGGAAGSDGVVDGLQGQLGNDTYILGNGADNVDEVTFGGGIDTITSTITRSLLSYTNIENLTLVGGGAANATGTGGANVLIGNTGVNRLQGGAGKDIQTGGLGNDRFVFKTAADSLVGGNRDVITDFTVAGTLERIDLSAFAGSFAFRGTGPFTSATKEVSYKFSGANTLVKIDLDGDAAAEMEIMLIGHKVLGAGDFFL